MYVCDRDGNVCMYVWTGSRASLPGNVMVKFITESGAALTKIADVNSNLVCMYVCIYVCMVSTSKNLYVCTYS